MIVLLAILAAVAVSSWLAIRTTQPIRRLTAAAQRAADGDLSVRVEPEGASELRTLGASVNAMLTTSQQLVEQVMRAGVAVNSSAALLSASSDELAATTTQQSAAVTQATSTTEELARASAAIADTVDEVAEPDRGDQGQPASRPRSTSRCPASAPSSWPAGSTTSTRCST